MAANQRALAVPHVAGGATLEPGVDRCWVGSPASGEAARARGRRCATPAAAVSSLCVVRWPDRSNCVREPERSPNPPAALLQLYPVIMVNCDLPRRLKRDTAVISDIRLSHAPKGTCGTVRT